MKTNFSKFKIILVFAIVSIFSLPLCAEESDHSKWLPSLKCFDDNNIYFSLEGSFATPVVFSGGDKLTGIGFGGGAEFGFDLNGWLLGLDYTFLYYGDNDGLMKNFMHNIATLSFSKIFSNSQIKFFPSWLDFRFGLFAGIDFASADYFVNIDAKQDGVLTSKNDFGFVYGASAFFEFGSVPYITPFVGGDFYFTHDKGGLYFMPVITAGVRTSIGKIKKGRL